MSSNAQKSLIGKLRCINGQNAKEHLETYWELMILMEDGGFPGPQRIPYHPGAKWGVRAFGSQNEPKMEPNTKTQWNHC